MKRTRVWLAALIAVFALIVAACASNDDEGPTAGSGTTAATGTSGATGTTGIPAFTTIEEGKLTVGSCLDYPPFESVKAGDETGFDVDITEEIASRLGLEVVWVKADFDTIFTAVAGDQFDMVAAASTITDEREQVVDFSVPYYNALQSLTVNTQETPDITSTDQLGQGDVVGVQKGTTGKIWAEENLVPQGVELKTFTTSPGLVPRPRGGQHRWCHQRRNCIARDHQGPAGARSRPADRYERALRARVLPVEPRSSRGGEYGLRADGRGRDVRDDLRQRTSRPTHCHRSSHRRS